MSSSSPKVSILLPIYNAERFVEAALRSMMTQTYQDWEMICVNDGSRDTSGAIADRLANEDSRIRVVHQTNCGLVRSLNRGIDMVRGPYVARMDADDIAMPDRLAQQVAYLDSQSQCVAVGGAILKIDVDSDPLGIDRLPQQHMDIERALLERRTGLFHPTTMLRTDALRSVGGYRPQYEMVEDHDLWLRLAERGQLANLSSVVLCYRLHAGSICWQRASRQRTLMNQLLEETYAKRGLVMPQDLLRSEDGGVARRPGKWRAWRPKVVRLERP